jgi:anti-sigma regulatory factor (Ser/Thr protein kinase)
VETRIELALETTGTSDADGAHAGRDAVLPPADPDPPPGSPVVVALSGQLSERAVRPLVQRLHALLVRHGGVVADVSAVELTHSGAVHAFAEAAARAGEWPDVRLALAGPDATLAALLASSRVAERVLVHTDVATAIAHLDDRPELLRGYWHFEVDPRAPGDARGHVRRVCRRWGIDEDAREAAEIVVTELVTNAVEHASSASVVEVWRRDRSLRLMVRDFDLAVLPGAHLPDPTAPRGRGLAMVAAVAQSWGVDPHRDGKTVWAQMETV